MTDLEMTRLCADAIGLKLDVDGDYISWGSPVKYDPLHDDAQAMALVKKFGLHVWRAVWLSEEKWYAEHRTGDAYCFSIDDHASLNRAIVECVAKMQVERQSTRLDE